MSRLTRSQKAWIIGGLTALIFLGANLTFAILGYSTRDPSECGKCHTDSYRLWKDNKFHKLSIKCVYCHSSVSSSQYAYIPNRLYAIGEELDRECLKCHENFMDEEKLQTTIFAEWVDKESGKVKRVFGPWSLKEVACRGKFSCLACHKNMAHDRAILSTNLPRVEYCAACHYHREKDAFCQVYPGPRLVFVKQGKRLVSPSIR